jgi:hypothetical protein
MSTELVPFTDVREAWNTIHGKELQAHNNALTAEQSARITEHYDVEAYVGAHGIIGEGLQDPNSWPGLPTNKEYDEAKKLVDGMQPGDVLLTELYGFDVAGREPVPPSYETPRLGESPMDKWIGRMLLQATGVQQTEYEAKRTSYIEGKRQELEVARSEFKISAWEYARGLAVLKGIRVVHADYDAFDEAALTDLSGEGDLIAHMSSDDPDRRELAKRIETAREQKACNIVKDWALDHLPPEGTPPPDGHKPRLVLLFGRDDKEGLQKAFDDIGLPVKFTEMEFTEDVRERIREKLFIAIMHRNSALASDISSFVTASRSKDTAGR